MTTRTLALLLITLSLGPISTRAAESVVLDESNYDAIVPKGKEVDALYGDIVLSNDQIIAVIAKPIAGRNANLTVKEVAGCLIDLTRKDSNSDQLSAFYPNATRTPYRSGESLNPFSYAVQSADEAKDGDKASPIAKPKVTTTYALEAGWDYIQIATTFTNASSKAMNIALSDSLRADKSFDQGFDDDLGMFWVYDRWFGQAYGLVVTTENTKLVAPAGSTTPGRTASTVNYEHNGKREVTLKPGESFTLTRLMIPGDHAFQIRAIAAKLAKQQQTDTSFHLKDGAGDVVSADVILYHDAQRKKVFTRGRTDKEGRIETQLPAGKYFASIYSSGRTSQEFEVIVDAEKKQTAVLKEMDTPGTIVAKITSDSDGPIPCKVQFIGIEPTKDPFFFVDSGEHEVHNCHYSHNGSFRQHIGAGKYQVIISYGPEFDAVFTQVEVISGKETPLAAKLVRSVNTKGWISTDFHSHSSPSGDNTSSQLGRVLNLLAEHIEFAPCTEHQRIDSYVPHLKRLGALELLATCTGMELTGSPLPMNHQNVFPLIHKPHTQDGGGPLTDKDPRAQIERVYLWDNKSEKVVQQNHPDIVKMFFDKDGDGKMDKGFDMAPFMSVIEVHPPAGIFADASGSYDGKKYRDTMLRWMQTLNQGYRVPGVVNTDSHYNFHGSGWLRNWVKSPTDDPAKVQTLDVVRETNKGHIIMSTGPFMEVRANSAAQDSTSSLPGDGITALGGEVTLQVRVECPNWFDINRVQIFVNGRADPKLNFTRKSHPKMFGDKAIKFDQRIEVNLKSDAHLIVAAVGEGLTLGPVMGTGHGKDVPVAVSNPIFVDVDGAGFKANNDDLGLPLKK